MKLQATQSFDLPAHIEPVAERGFLVAPDGALWVLVRANREHLAVCRIHPSGIRVAVLEDLGRYTRLHHKPSLVELPEGIGVLVTPDELRFYDSDLSPTHSRVVGGADVFAGFTAGAGAPRLRAQAFTGLVNGCLPVVLDYGGALGNPRVIGLLEASGDAARWRGTLTCRPEGRPSDRFGHEAANVAHSSPAETCIVGDARSLDGQLVVALEGMNATSVPRYGMDFFSLERVALDGARLQVYYEQSGWKRQPGKHGIRAKLTTSGRYAILTPWFSSGEWRGRQRLFDFSTGELLEFSKPRGAADFLLVDHGVDHGGDHFWMSDLHQRVLMTAATP